MKESKLTMLLDMAVDEAKKEGLTLVASVMDVRNEELNGWCTGKTADVIANLWTMLEDIHKDALKQNQVEVTALLGGAIDCFRDFIEAVFGGFGS